MLLFVCLFHLLKQIKLDILPWTMSVDGYRAYLLLCTALKVLGAIIIFFIIITVEPRLLELWEETKNNSS